VVGHDVWGRWNTKPRLCMVHSTFISLISSRLFSLFFAHPFEHNPTTARSGPTIQHHATKSNPKHGYSNLTTLYSNQKERTPVKPRAELQQNETRTANACASKGKDQDIYGTVLIFLFHLLPLSSPFLGAGHTGPCLAPPCQTSNLRDNSRMRRILRSPNRVVIAGLLR